jgi:hypothetical protein
MKRIMTLIIIICLLSLPLIAEEEDSPWNFIAEFDMYLGVKMGVKYEINDRFDFVSTFGKKLTGVSHYCYSFYGSYKSMSNFDHLSVDVNFGIIQGVIDNTSAIDRRFLYINPGIAMHISYEFIDGFRIGAQGGMMLTIGNDINGWWLGFEPYAGLTFSIEELALFKK